MVVMGVVLITAILISVVNLIADIRLAALNPQVHIT
jgi:ABC-type dipeptide/oligopeptide/nickel transport system permease component